MLNKPSNIPDHSKFLEGTGDSAWFFIEETHSLNQFLISRYTIDGFLECKYLSILQDKGFNISEDFEFTFVSHCAKCTIIQNNKTYTFIKYDS